MMNGRDLGFRGMHDGDFVLLASNLTLSRVATRCVYDPFEASIIPRMDSCSSQRLASTTTEAYIPFCVPSQRM